MTGCDFLWAACGVRGAVPQCAVLCLACVRPRRCACTGSDACALRSCRGCAGRPAGVRGFCVCMLRVSVRCAVRGLLAWDAGGDSRHNADVPLWCVGFVAFVCVRGVMVVGSAVPVGMCVRCVYDCENLNGKSRDWVIPAV